MVLCESQGRVSQERDHPSFRGTMREYVVCTERRPREVVVGFAYRKPDCTRWCVMTPRLGQGRMSMDSGRRLLEGRGLET